MADWKDTKLWLLLRDRPAEEAKTVQTMLETCMPDIQDILARGGTSPNDFTLHDAEHSYRVAQRMVDITPEDVRSQLSTYELALLLLSAYLHDIGMTPERQKVRQHYVFLLTGDPEGLIPAEQNEFQAWLDDEGDGVVPPLATHSPTGEVLRRAEEIITYYARHKHNDWSGEWIEAHREWFKAAYVSFTDDLIRVCKSHHEGYKELVLDQFNPHNVGGAIVHLRYLAVLLRLADILEFDPERTPEVVLRHRDIAPKSLIYWYKDHEVSITQDGNRLVAYARPREARMHRAIEVMLDDIEKEMRVCRTLADETHFENSPGIQEKLPHRWDLSGTLHREDVKPQNNRYEYINGAFRPDTRKILELLSGIELYGSPFVAVRELLQNAFDAIREQIAYQRLDLPDPNDATAVNALETLCNVSLKLEQSEDGFWLICTDNGVGMTKDIINRYLLVSGSARRHEILDLERRCKAQGFTLGRTGQFGIGVLSYFMLADRLELRTRRSQEAGSDEQTGWRFTTEGIGSFGELNRDAQFRRGTQIRLHLKREFLGDAPERWYIALRDYLTETLCYLPCGFRFETNIPGCEPFSALLGWPNIREKLIKMVTDVVPTRASLHDISYELLPPSQQSWLTEQENELASIRLEAQSCLDFHVVAGNLPDGMGHYRIHIAYFRLPGGIALGYLPVHEEQGNLHFTKSELGHYFVWNGGVQASWKGMHINLVETLSPRSQSRFSSYLKTILQRRCIFVEIDLNSTETGGLAVDRNNIVVGEKISVSLLWLRQQIHDSLITFLSTHDTSLFTSFNRHHTLDKVFFSKPMHWLSNALIDGHATDLWRPILFPATVSAPLDFSAEVPNFSINSKHVSFVLPLESIHYYTSGIHYLQPFEGLIPDKIVLSLHHYAGFAKVWLDAPRTEATAKRLATCAFPPEWANLCGILEYGSGYDDDSVIWNQDHILAQLWSIEADGWSKTAFRISPDPLPYRNELLQDRNKAAAWLRYYIRMDINSERYSSVSDLWDSVIERDSDFLSQLWPLLFTISHTEGQEWLPLYYWTPDILYIVTPSQHLEIEHQNSEDWLEYLPDVSPEWRLEAKFVNKEAP